MLKLVHDSYGFDIFMCNI